MRSSTDSATRLKFASFSTPGATAVIRGRRRSSPRRPAIPLAGVLMCVAMIVMQVAQCNAGSLTPEQMNFGVLSLSAEIDFGSIVATQGVSYGSSITINGTYNALGWSNTSSGTYLGNSLSMNYTGTFDQGTSTSSWTQSGSYGASGVASAGSGEFSPDGSTLTWSQSGTVGTSAWAFSGPLSVQSINGDLGISGNLSGTVDGQGAVAQISLEPDLIGKIIFLIVILAPSAFSIHTLSSGDPSIGPPVVGVMTVSAVPEPSSLFMMAVGVGVAFVVFRMQRRGR